MNAKLFCALLASPILSTAAVNVAHACAPYGLIGQKAAQFPAQLGPCLNDEADDGAGGRIQAFKYGWIDWDGKSSQAYAVWGLVAQKWNQLGLAPGYGHPTDDESVSYAGRGGAYNFFSNGGSIVWEQGAAQAYEIHGDIRAAYGADGAEYGDLGFPVSDEDPASGNERVNYFEHGQIYWIPGGRETIVHVYGQRITYTIPSITFGGGVPVGSDQPFIVSLYSNGNYTFQGGFHCSSDFILENVNFLLAATGASGATYTFSHASPGMNHLGKPTDDWYTSGNNPQLATGFADLERNFEFHYDSSASLDLTELWSGLQDAIGYVSKVVALVGSL